MPALERVLQRWFGPDVALARRIGASAFLVGVAAMLASGGLSLLFSLSAIPRAGEQANRQALQLFATQVGARIEGHEQAIRSIAGSTLVWTAISDSYGREAYLRPFLNDQEKTLGGHHLQLLDYRGRRIYGDELPLDTRQEVQQLARMVMTQGRVMGTLAGPARPGCSCCQAIRCSTPIRRSRSACWSRSPTFRMSSSRWPRCWEARTA